MMIKKQCASSYTCKDKAAKDSPDINITVADVPLRSHTKEEWRKLICKESGIEFRAEVMV